MGSTDELALIRQLRDQVGILEEVKFKLAAELVTSQAHVRRLQMRLNELMAGKKCIACGGRLFFGSRIEGYEICSRCRHTAAPTPRTCIGHLSQEAAVARAAEAEQFWCCTRAGEYNGFHAQETLFVCPHHCSCHD